MRRRGFSLVELVVTLGVVGAITGLATYRVVRSRERVSVTRATTSLRAEIERARALARVAGPRLGTARIVYGPNCNPSPGQLLWISLAPDAVTIPRTVTYSSDTDELTVTCTTWEQGGLTGPREWVMIRPTDALVFGFSANGRLVFPTGEVPRFEAAPDVFIQLAARAGENPVGFRVLPSGLTCDASDPDAIDGQPCDVQERDGT